MINFEKELNPAQLEAVVHLSGPALVIAGAGSGKTRVIEYRVLYLVQNRIPPSSILLLTFTRKAAYEMLSRAEKHNFNCKKVEGGTFHSFAWKMLKNYGKIIDLPPLFSILDEDDSQQVIRRCSKLISLDKSEKMLPKKETIKNIISMSINKEMSISEILDREYPHFLEYLPQIEDIKESYAKYKREKNYLDYDDLLVYLRTLLKDKTVRENLSRRYQYIMVDEYQDTNILQGDITYWLAEKHQNVMVVGDDAQSIYGFRGASHRNIMEFPKRFPHCKIIKLQDNYRSTQSILNVGNCILENMKNKYSKCLISAKEQKGEAPKVLLFKDAYEEAEWIADKIECQREEKIPLFSQCVLFRSAYVSFPLQAELTKRSIPYQVFGGIRFQEMAHIKDIISYFRVVNNIRDEIAWRRALLLIEGIGEKTAEHITEDIILSNTPHLAIENWVKKNHKYEDDLKKLNDMLKNISSKKISPEEKFAMVFSYYLPTFKEKFDDWNTRINDLLSLKQISSRYDSVEQFLVDLAVESPDKGVRDIELNIGQKERPLTLSTIHSAKGLEWECVFFLGLVDGVLPSYFALKDEEEIEEERRLFYVGVTRAKKYLFLSLHWQGVRGGVYQLNSVSRFLNTPNVLSKLQSDTTLDYAREYCV